jgi:hypothetical protein
MSVQNVARFITNQEVTTPLGKGMVLAPFAVQLESGETVTVGILVKLPVNEVTTKALKQSNCLTPKAKVSGLWVFPEGELQ